jgi:excisionase family DNA binding protein
LPALLSVREAARMLTISEATVRRLIADGAITPIRLRQVAGASVRLRASDVRALIDPPADRELEELEQP